MDILQQLVESGKIKISCNNITSICDDNNIMSLDDYFNVVKLILSSNTNKYITARTQMKTLVAVTKNLNSVNPEIAQMITDQIICIFDKFLTRDSVKLYDAKDILKMIQFLDDNNMNDVLDEIVKNVFTLIELNKNVSKYTISLIVHLPNSLGGTILNKLLTLTKFNNVFEKHDIIIKIINDILYELKKISDNTQNNNDFNKYDTIIDQIVNNNYVSSSIILSLMKIFYSDNYKNNTSILADRIYILCDENKKTEIASLVPSFYITDRLISKNKRKYGVDYENDSDNDDDDDDIQTKNNIGYLNHLMCNVAPYMKDDVIEAIILAVHGCYDSNKLFLKRLFNNKKSDTYSHKRKKFDDSFIISNKLFCINSIKLINLHFPKQVKKTIQEYAFEHMLCTYRNNHDPKIFKELVRYIILLNEWSYLPYELICSPYIEKTEKHECCPLCLNDTEWNLIKCKHAICKKCCVNTIYEKNHETVQKEFACISCVTCVTLKILQETHNDFDEFIDFNDSDDEL